MDSNEDVPQERTHVVPEAILIKEEDGEADIDLDMVVDMEEVELREQMNFKAEDMDGKEDLADDELDAVGYDNKFAPKVELEECEDNDEEEEKMGPNKDEVDEDFEPDENDDSEDNDDDGDWTEKVDSKDDIWEEVKGFKGGTKNKVKREFNGYKDSPKQPLIMELRKEIKNLRATLHRCRQQKQAMKTPKEAKIKKWVREYITEHHSRVWANFICDDKSDRAGCFTEQEILKAIGLRRISKKAYNYMRDNKLCPLPGNATMKNWINNHPEWDIPTQGEYVRPKESKVKGSGNISDGTTVNPCGQCGKNFTQKALLFEHLAVVHGDEKIRKRMQCNVCDKWLSSDKRMKGHQNMHMGLKTYKCTFCDRTYQNQGNMAAHRKQAHAAEWKELRGKLTSQGRKSSKPCQTCGIHLSSIAELNQHMAEVHGDTQAKETQCQTCGKWTMSKIKLKDHMRTHTGERPYTCDFCPQSFMSKGTQSAHLKEKHPVEWDLYKDQIKARNRIEGNLKMREAHANRKLGKPGFAPYAGGWKRSVSHNTNVKSDGEVPILDEATGMVNEDVFKCDICDKAYITKDYMLAHQKKVHKDEWQEQVYKRRIASKTTSNPCPLCGADLPVAALLNKHLAEVHDDPVAMQLQCTTCKKWLGSKQLLENHMTTHSDERPYKCDFCPKRYKTNKQMGFHRKEVHHEEWEANKGSLSYDIFSFAFLAPCLYLVIGYCILYIMQSPILHLL